MNRALDIIGGVSIGIFGALVIAVGLAMIVLARLLFWPVFALMYLANGATLVLAQLCGFLGGLGGCRTPKARQPTRPGPSDRSGP